MKYISLSNSSLTVFRAKGKLSEMSGSSKYKVFDNEIIKPEKNYKGKFEQTSAKSDYLNELITDNLSFEVYERLVIRYYEMLLTKMQQKNVNFEFEDRIAYLEKLLSSAEKFNPEFILKKQNIIETIKNVETKKHFRIKTKQADYKLNKSKVRGKIYALFNLKNSSKFVAFYSVSFPANNKDNEILECWNYFLTYCRKNYNLTNYIWITERQKNGTLHYHMFTNNWLPILQINRAMAIIIDNKVKAGVMNWNNCSLNKFNGVDVDSIFNSKRHKKTGKQFNPAQLRDWLAKYVTKYVTKNSETFNNLCWHCSRSVSVLFTSQVFLFDKRNEITQYLPQKNDKYYQVKSEFNHTCVFKFVPVQNIFYLIRLYNDWLSVEFEPIKKFESNKITFKTTIL